MNTNPEKQNILNQAQKDKFLMVLDVPPFLQKLKLGSEKEDIGITSLQLTIFGSVVPAANVPNVANGYSGQIQHVTSMARPEFSPLTLNFVVDNKYHNYYLLWRWFAGLNDPKRSVYTIEPGNPKIRGLYDYQTNMTIFGLDEYNKKVIEFKYLHVFPVGLGGIEYSYQDTGGLISNVTFQFDQLLVNLIEGA